MSCGKNLDGLSMFTEGGGGDLPNNPTITGDVTITGDLEVQGGDVLLGVGVDGWSNIRSHTSAFGLDIMAPLTKKIRLINDIQSVAEIDTKFKLVGGTGNVAVTPAPSTTTYDFILPTAMGANGLVLTSQGSGQPLYWTAGGGGGGGGTVTSVAITVPTFLSVAGSPITTSGTFTITLSGTPLPVLNGGTGTTTSTGTGSVVLDTSPTLITPNIGVATGLILNLTGTTSDTVSIRVQPVAGTYNFNLPTTAGSPGQVLTSQGGGVAEMTWSTPAAPGTGTVTSVGIVPPSFLNASAAITTSGNITLSYNGTPLPVLNGGTGTTTSTGTGSVVLSISPTLTGTLTTVTITASGDISTSSTTPSTTTTTGAIRSGGGLGVVGNANIGGTLTSPNILSTGQISAQGQLNTTATTASTSSTTGALLSAGGLGVAGDAFIRQSVNVNYGGTAVAPQLKISPVTTGGISTVAFYRGVNNSSHVWTLGHGSGGSGDGNFAISSTESGLNKLIITPSGPVSLPSGASSLTFIDITGSATGTISIRAQANAGTYNYNLPIAVGLPGQVLTSQGGAATPMTWTTITSGTVTSVSASVPSFLSLTGSPITSSGTLAITYSGTPLPVLNGGTGVTTSTGSGSNVLSTLPTLTNPLTNSLGIQGSTSGTISILPQAIAGTYNFNLPTTAGTPGQVLTSAGGVSAPMTWSNVGSGTVTSVGLAVPAFLNVSGSPIVSNGTITVGLSGTPLLIANGGTSSTTATGTGSVVLQNSPTLTGTLNCGRILAAASIFPSASVHGYFFNNTDSAGPVYVNGFNFPNVPVGTDMYTGTGIGLTGALPATLVGFHYRTGATSFASLSVYGCTVPLVTDVTGQVRVQANIPSTSTTTGSLLVTGGIGATGAINAAGAITTTSTTASTTPATGSIIAGGGIGAAGAINAGAGITATRIATSTSVAHSFSSGVNTFTNNNNTSGFNTSFENPSQGNGISNGFFVGKTPATEGIGFTYEKNATAGQSGLHIFHANIGESVAILPPGTASTTTTTGTVKISGGLGVNGRVCATEFQTDAPAVFRYRESVFIPIVTCAGHTAFQSAFSGNYTLMGNICYWEFSTVFDLTTGPLNDLVMTAPFAASGDAAGQCYRNSDLLPGVSVDKDFSVNIQAGTTTARFSFVSSNVGNSAWVNYNSAQTGCRVQGCITYRIA